MSEETVPAETRVYLSPALFAIQPVVVLDTALMHHYLQCMFAYFQ